MRENRTRHGETNRAGVRHEEDEWIHGLAPVSASQISGPLHSTRSIRAARCTAAASTITRGDTRLGIIERFPKSTTISGITKVHQRDTGYHRPRAANSDLSQTDNPSHPENAFALGDRESDARCVRQSSHLHDRMLMPRGRDVLALEAFPTILF